MKLIKLTQNQVSLVDDEDFDFISQWKWQANWDKKTKSYRAMRTEYFPKKKTVFLHRVVMKSKENEKCDHKNHDTLDNRKQNLRNVTNSQNLMNLKSATSRNSLGVLGVQRHNKKFRAYIMINKKQICSGVQETIDDAILERKNLEKRYFGEFAYQEHKG